MRQHDCTTPGPEYEKYLKLQKHGGKMTKILFSLSLMMILLVACSTQPPVEPTPDESPASYPPPSPAEPTQAAYPGPDDPVSSDSPSAYPSPLEPLPGEEDMDRGQVFVDDTQLLVMESFPPQYLLQVRGSLPTPCHNLRANISGPDAQNRIIVEAFSLVDPQVTCIQVLEPFQTGFNLGSLPQGVYTVLLNGEQVAEINAP
jgi:hypothetical protein